MKNEEAIESWLTELLENKDFSELTKTELEKVLAHSSEESYQLERTVILQSKELFLLSDKFEPKPLIIDKKPVGLLSSTIPLYQALLAVAAVFLFMYLAIPFTKIVGSENNNNLRAQVDTLWLETIKYDTIEVIVEKPIVKEKIVYVNQIKDKIESNEEPRLLNVPPSSFSPDLTSATLLNEGRSLKDDAMRLSLPSVN